MENKKCSECKIIKSISDFYKNQYKCKECSNNYWKKWKNDNKEYLKQKYSGPRERNRKFKLRYGITTEDFNNIFEKQNGKCKVCDIDLDLSKRHGAHLDHNHITKEIRGILCWPCNRKLGYLEKNPKLNQKLAIYANLEWVKEFWPQKSINKEN